MKTFLKTLIGGALGLGALYVVGKVCYEAGKDVAEVERQLGQSTDNANEMGCPAGMEPDGRPDDDVGGDESQIRTKDPNRFGLEESDGKIERVLRDAKEKMAKGIDEAFEKNSKPTLLGKAVDKIRNAKMFVRMKKVFEKKGDRSPGILGSLLSNPDGARIEAFVRNGGVQINVTPRAA